MPSHKNKDAVPGKLDDGSFDLSAGGEVDEAFLAEVEAQAVAAEATANPPEDHPEGAAAEEAGLPVDSEAVEQLRHELAQAIEARKRALADFSNYQRRAADNEERVRDAATSAVIRSFIPVLDHMELAEAQSESEMTIEQLMDGVRLLRMEIKKAFQQFDVEEIRPELEAEFNPNEHQAVMRQPTDQQPSNTVVSVLQVGYRRDDVVIRPATVTVAAPIEE